eukprot:CAMPEP_0205816886 /NCGR_PEP_ID=MMETSP0205-20121125/23397_1 /ASSEMBLY_ACC=CAM_ASM_000278 /TAXON_ID=36767 /ORGANISM="Euplotes focardii, Strain TN1" /LENGTH=175 /DNA_ID=CAMNT_0053106127 /DNA_START=256 /DNA_END=783 /DNA_ORIENTATION=-
MDPRYAAYYGLISFIMWLIVKIPRYNGKSNIVKLKTEDEFEQFLAAFETKDKNKKKNYGEMNSSLIIFGASWCDNCTFTYPLWVEFSNKYGTKRLKFGEIDVQKNERLAKEHKVNLSGIAGQLPTLILFQDGEECLRFPPLMVTTGNYAKVNQYKKKELIKYFDLDKRYAATNGL